MVERDENQRQEQDQEQSASATAGPQIHPPGRISGAPDDAAAAQEPSAEHGVTTGSETVSGEAEGVRAQEDSAEPEHEQQEGEAAQQLSLAYVQRRRRKLLHDCERLLLLDFDTLAIPHWPDHYQLTQARKRRDTWLIVLGVFATLVLAGMGNLVPAVVAGVGFGLLVLCGLWSLPAVRHIFSDRSSYAELLLRRRHLIQRARKHVEQLEGKNGLAACCRGLCDYNPALRRSRFQRLYRLSERGLLAGQIRSRAKSQLYLIFALEAEKAYNRLRETYLSAYQEELDSGEAPPLDATAEATDPDELLVEVSSDEPEQPQNEADTAS